MDRSLDLLVPVDHIVHQEESLLYPDIGGSLGKSHGEAAAGLMNAGECQDFHKSPTKPHEDGAQCNSTVLKAFDHSDTEK